MHKASYVSSVVDLDTLITINPRYYRRKATCHSNPRCVQWLWVALYTGCVASHLTVAYTRHDQVKSAKMPAFTAQFSRPRVKESFSPTIMFQYRHILILYASTTVFSKKRTSRPVEKVAARLWPTRVTEKIKGYRSTTSFMSL